MRKLDLERLLREISSLPISTGQFHLLQLLSLNGLHQVDETAGSVFDAFRRGNNVLAAGIPGTGLGLAIVREVIEQAGGRIFVHSRLGEGSTFVIAIPARDASVKEPKVRDTRRSVTVLPEGPTSVSDACLVES